MKQNVICICAETIVMLLLPWLAASWVKPDLAMPMCMLLFFVINPITVIWIGSRSGKHLKAAGFQPLLSAVLYLSGAWLFLAPGEKTLFFYALAYLILGYTAAITSHLYETALLQGKTGDKKI